MICVSLLSQAVFLFFVFCLRFAIFQQGFLLCQNRSTVFMITSYLSHMIWKANFMAIFLCVDLKTKIKFGGGIQQ